MRRILVSVGLVAPVAAVGLLVGCIGCSRDGKPGGSVRLSGGGSTFVDPIMQKWSSEYNKATGVEVDYTKSGSTDGIQKMTEKELDFGASDAPMKKDQLENARAKGGEVVHVPLIMGGVAVIHSAPNVPDLKLSGPVIADIYLGKVKKWNDDAIAKLNPGVALPDLAIVPVYRAEGSGTSNIFTEFLSKVSPEFAQRVGASTSPKWPEIGTGQKGSDGVANHVKANAGCIGYVEVSYAKKNSIPVAAIQNSKGQFTRPEADAVTAAGEWALTQPQTKEPYSLHQLTFSLTNADHEKAYPICGITYAILYQKQPTKKGQALVEFLKWATTEGQKYAVDLYYAPLPAELGRKVAERLGQVQFEG
ncbi:MAG: phosphate ABC transporter substrate-binding protein PstS [Zavarzinella sp.]|nr:phosphate ABC transporter substrate-binding protein PstS [Zavarzinella sp.]